MPLFTHRRERQYWLLAFVVVIAIYATLPLAGTWAGFLRSRDLLAVAFVASFLMVTTAIIGQSLSQRPHRTEIWIILGIIAAYVMVWTRMEIPEERTHLFEYGLVAVFVLRALEARKQDSHQNFSPAVVAILLTALIGWLDEALQALLPNRVYDLRDVGFNALAALMAVLASQILTWARRKYRQDLESNRS